jgi:hypothetical protein
MQKITFEDYKKAIRAKFEIEKDGVYFNFLTPPSQANLRNLCWERFKSNTSVDDLSVFSSFFEFEFDPTRKNSFREQTDRFRPIGSFLRNEKDPANRYAVELAAILVDFQSRPFKKYKERGVVILEEPIGSPKLPFAFNYNDKEEKEQKERNHEEKEDGYENKNEDRFENPLIAANQLGFMGNSVEDSLNSLKEKNNNKYMFIERLLRLLKKSKRTVFAILFTFGLAGTGTAIYLAFFKKDNMQWSKDHYEVVDKEGIEGNPNEIIDYDEHLLDFKKLIVCDTTTCFKPDGEAIVWYAKTGDKADFFNSNGNGRHPETKRSLRPITEYIKGKYKGNCPTK